METCRNELHRGNNKYNAASDSGYQARTHLLIMSIVAQINLIAIVGETCQHDSDVHESGKNASTETMNTSTGLVLLAEILGYVYP